MRLFAAHALAFVLLALFAFAPVRALADGSTEQLVIVTGKGPVTFDVEVMRTDEERAKGLMYRRYMPSSAACCSTSRPRGRSRCG